MGSFEEKLKASLGKLPVFMGPQSKTDKNAHFAISHYAGIVSHGVTNWLEKNKDPVNDTVVEIMKSASTCKLLVYLWLDHPGQPTTSPKEEGRKKKKSGGKTVSSVYLVSLMELMATLHNCEPHFVRCLVPNTHKKPGEVEPPLIMHQLTCNGVLEGIRICMRGFPNRMLYPDYKMRYSCLGQAEISSSSDNKTATYALMDKIEFDRERYRLGHTLVFFRAGALAKLEEARDDLVIKWVRMIQGEVLKRIRGKVYAAKRDQRELIKVAQRNFRKYLQMRDWGWFVIIQKTRAMIGRPNPEEELRQLEEKANATYGEYKAALDKTAELEGSMDDLKAEIAAMTKQLAEEQGSISVYTDRQAKANTLKASCEAELAGQVEVLKSEENSRVALAQEVKAHSGSIGAVKKDIEDVELMITKVETEKGNRDHTIRTLQDEIAEQDEVINKLNEEKKHLSATQAKSNEDLMGAEEKVKHLSQVKSQLESTLDQLEGGFDKEKKARATIEKQKRKIEGDLKMAQDSVNDLEREKRDIENTIGNKEKNVLMLSAKLDDEQSLVAKAQKNIKELQARVEAAEEELEAERQARSKAERQRSDLAREIEQLGDRYDQASGATVAQVELNKKREAEIVKLRKDVEEANIASESVLSNLKRKQGDSVLEMQEQIDALAKMKAKIDKDKQTIMAEIADARAATEEVVRSQASTDKSNKALVETLNAINKKLDAANLTIGDFAMMKNKIANENGELLRIVGDLENSLNMLAKAKSALGAQLNDVKALCDNEARDRQLLLGKYRNLEHEVDVAKEALDEEAAGRDNVLRLNAKAEGDAAAMRQKYEQDAVAKAEELEMTKMKLAARNTEAEAARAMVDAARLADELRCEQELSMALEKERKLLEAQCKDTGARADEAEVSALKGGRKAMIKMETRIRELESELDAESRRNTDVFKNLRKSERSIKELSFAGDEDRKNHERMQSLIDQLQGKVKSYEKQIEEAEEIAALNLAKYRKVAGALGDAEASADANEQAMAMRKARAKSASLGL